MIIVSRIIHVKVDRRLNVRNKFKYQRRLSSRLAIVMFRGTPCRFCNTLYFTRYVILEKLGKSKKFMFKTSVNAIRQKGTNRVAKMYGVEILFVAKTQFLCLKTSASLEILNYSSLDFI